MTKRNSYVAVIFLSFEEYFHVYVVQQRRSI